MLRHVLAGALVATLALPVVNVVDLDACGDKFLRAGRSPRMKGYATMYSASILIYPSPTANRQDVAGWQKILKQAGHKPHVMVQSADFARTLAAGAFDLVITDYVRALKVQADISAAASKPGVLPVLSSSNKALTDRARAEFAHFIDLEKEPREALEEIDHVMEARLKSISAASKP